MIGKRFNRPLGAIQIESNEPAFSASRLRQAVRLESCTAPFPTPIFLTTDLPCVDFGIADPSNGLILMEEELIKAQK